MSSSNAVQIIMVPETTYGVTPALPTAPVLPVRFTSESLSGTPQTAESAEARADRMSGGQVVTGLDSGGDINSELSQSPTFDELFRMGMMSSWTGAAGIVAPVAGTIAAVAGNDQLADITLTGVDFTDIDGAGTAVLPGDLLVFSGFANASNNGPRQVVTATAAGVARVIVPRGSVVAEAAVAVETEVPSYVEIGTEVHSATFSKAYTDVTHAASTDQHSQRYPGGLVNQIAVNMTWGQIITSVFSILANGYLQEVPSLAQQITAAGGTVPPSATDQPLNGSVDMPMVTVDGQPTDFCIQSLNFTLNNNLQPQNCLGKIAPSKYNAGTAAIQVTAAIYLGDPSYDRFMPAKLTQAPVGMFFATSNMDGGYAFDFRAVQLSFPDPNSGGRDQQVMINAAGVAKVGPGGSSALRIYRLGVTP